MKYYQNKMIKINDLYFEIIKKIDKAILEEFECNSNNIEIKKIWKDRYFDVELDFSEKPTEISESLIKNKNSIIVFKEDINLIHELKISFFNAIGNTTKNQYKKFIKFEVREKRYESLVEFIISLEDNDLVSFKINPNHLGKFDCKHTELLDYKKIEEYLNYKELEIKNNSQEAQDFFQLNYDIDLQKNSVYGALDRIFNKIYRIL